MPAGLVKVRMIGKSEQVANAGIGSVGVVKDVFTGGVAYVSVGLNAYGPAPSAAFTVISPDQRPLLTLDPIPWQGDPDGSGSVWTVRFPVDQSGQYILEFTGDDVYSVDDRAILEPISGDNLIVDWQAPAHPLPDLLNWQQNSENPALIITPRPPEQAGRPTIVLEAMETGISSEIGFFEEAHPLLVDINLDALEQLGFRGVNLPQDYRAIVETVEGQTLLAESEAALLIPAFPESSDEAVEKMVTTLFFNAARHLLEQGQDEHQNILTTPAQPVPGPDRLAIHPGEGNLWLEPVSSGSMENLAQTGDMSRPYPLWALLLTLAAMVFVIERILNLIATT